MIEYFDDPGATASTVDEGGWLHTGDLGTIDSRGLITVTGRLKEIIIRGGENIAPAEIEVALAAHPQVLRVAVLGLPDERWGEIVAAAVIVRDPTADGIRDDLESFARERLAKYKVPAQWFLVDDLPTTPRARSRSSRCATSSPANRPERVSEDRIRTEEDLVRHERPRRVPARPHLPRRPRRRHPGGGRRGRRSEGREGISAFIEKRRPRWP